MEIKINNTVQPELKEFLLTQEGITDVDINYDNEFVELNIMFNEETNPIIIMKYIELFEEYKHSSLIEFNKGYDGKLKTLKYNIDNMCCEYCYMGLVRDLFENEKIKSVKSNFDVDIAAPEVELLIEYSDDYDEQELIEYIKEKYN